VELITDSVEPVYVLRRQNSHIIKRFIIFYECKCHITRIIIIIIIIILIIIILYSELINYSASIIWQRYCSTVGETRALENIPPEELNILLCRFFIGRP